MLHDLPHLIGNVLACVPDPNRRRAVVAVARKLAVLLYRMWADGTEFRPVTVEGTA